MAIQPHAYWRSGQKRGLLILRQGTFSLFGDCTRPGLSVPKLSASGSIQDPLQLLFFPLLVFVHLVLLGGLGEAKGRWQVTWSGNVTE